MQLVWNQSKRLQMFSQISTEKERRITSVWQKDIIQGKQNGIIQMLWIPNSPNHPAQWPGIVEVVVQNQEGVKQSAKTIQGLHSF